TGFRSLSRRGTSGVSGCQAAEDGYGAAGGGEEQGSLLHRGGGRAVAVKAGCEPAGGEAEQEDWGQVVGRAQGEQGQGVQAQEEQLHRGAGAGGGPVGVQGEEDDGRAAD